MIVEAHNIGDMMSTLLRQRVGQKIFDFVTSATSDKGSIVRQGNLSKIVVPMWVTEDIPREAAVQMAKNVEIKLAWDVKKYVEMMISENPRDLSLAKVMKDLPITIIQKQAGQNNPLFSKEALNDLNIDIVEDGDGSSGIEVRLEQESLNYALEGYDKMYSEAATNSPIIQERNSLPTEIQIELKYLRKDDKIEAVKYFIGVEVIPRYVSSSELLVKMSTYDNKRFYKQFIALEKGEISFITDLLLDLSLVKKKADQASKGKNPLFKMIDKFNMLSEMGVNIYPFTTMFVSKEFADRALAEEHIDLEKDVANILKEFFSMGLFIYNQDLDLVNIFYDGDREFRKHDFYDVEKDTAKYERELKNLIKFNVK